MPSRKWQSTEFQANDTHNTIIIEEFQLITGEKQRAGLV